MRMGFLSESSAELYGRNVKLLGNRDNQVVIVKERPQQRADCNGSPLRQRRRRSQFTPSLTSPPRPRRL